MRKLFNIDDRYNGKDFTAKVVVDTDLQNGDCLEVIEVQNDRGGEWPFVSEDMEDQIKRAFLLQYEKMYNEILLTAA